MDISTFVMDNLPINGWINQSTNQLYAHLQDFTNTIRKLNIFNKFNKNTFILSHRTKNQCIRFLKSEGDICSLFLKKVANCPPLPKLSR